MITEVATGSYTSIALNSSDYPRISYYVSDLKHAYQDDAGWHLGIVGPASIHGPYASLALDRSGTPHISYNDWANSDLTYAYAGFISFRVYPPILTK